MSNKKVAGTVILHLEDGSKKFLIRTTEDKFINEAKVVLNPGISYGQEGSQHMRINLACPRATLKEGLQRIAAAFK